MMDPKVESKLRMILKSAKPDTGASDARLGELMAGLKYRFPEDYLEFMRRWNGYNGDVGEYGGVYIWAVEEILPANEANNFREWIPGLVLFASTGGGDFYAFDFRHDSPKVVAIPSIPLDVKDAVEVGASFTQFLEQLAQSKPQ
jgi:hypothetical protein